MPPGPVISSKGSVVIWITPTPPPIAATVNTRLVMSILLLSTSRIPTVGGMLGYFLLSSVGSCVLSIQIMSNFICL